MSNSLDATIEQVQAAFNNGDYRSVVESCTHIIDQYPNYTAAQRLLGLAHLEQGQSDKAEIWFARLLTHDPRDPAAYLGLGLIAEERGVLEHALAYCQVAWELAPYEASFRTPVNRVAGKRYGADGHLQLTRAALARIHANASRLRRAIKEYRAALTTLPDRIDLWIGLAEALWILGENAESAEIARELLKDHKELVPALIILADLERRTGDSSAAENYRERLRRLDPDGGLTAGMLTRHPTADTDFLLLKPGEQPRLAEWIGTFISERPQFAPGPDFTPQPEHDTGQVADIDELQPFSLEEFADDLPAAPDRPTSSSFLSAGLLDEEEPDTVEVEQAEDSLVDDASGQATDDAPVVVPEPAATQSLNLLDMDLDDEQPPFSDEPVDDKELEDLLEGIEPMSLDDFGASDDLPASESSGFFEDSDIDFDIKIEDPDAVQLGGGPPTGASGMFSDSPGPPDDFPELPEVDEPAPDAEIPSATPGEDPAGDELLDVDELGLEPFTLDDEDIDQVTSVASSPWTETHPDDDVVPPDAADFLSAETDPISVGTMDDASGLEPFDIDDFEDLGGTDIFDFGVLPWELQDNDEGDDIQELPDEVAGSDEPEASSLDPGLPASATEHLDIAEELDHRSLDPHFERRMAEVEQAARQNLDWLRRAQGQEPAEAASDVGGPDAPTAALHTNVTTPSAERLVADEALFQRTRTAKTGLIEQGIIKGSRELVTPPAAEAAADEPVLHTEPDTPEMEPVEQLAGSEGSQLGALRATIEIEPHNDDARWQYGEALRERGDIHAAFAEYRWLIRHAPDRHDAIISSLETCADNDQEADLAHRLLADIYRRRGDSAQARNHAAMALAARRLMRDAKM